MSCKRFNSARRYVSVGCILAIFSMASAQDSVDTKKNDSLHRELPLMTVNVMRTEVASEKMPQKIEVINKQDIDLTPAQDVTDLLKKNVSIDVVQYPGLLSGVGIRGFRPGSFGINQRTLTLINGRPSGATNFASLQPYNVERIEVVKGPVSALYGPQAMGGVVNIVPKHSTGEINTQLKFSAGSYETFEAVAHSGGAINKYLNFDFSGMLYNQGKDFRIGSEYILGKLSDKRFDGKATHILANGDSADVNDNIGAGTIRHNTKFDKHDFSLRLGTSLLDERLSVDVRGEMFGADAVEVPNDIAYGDAGAELKNIYRTDEEVTVRGNFEINKFKVLQYWTKENSENYEDFAYGETMYTSYSSGTEWLGFQVKDDIYLPTGDFILKPVITLGLDFNKVEEFSRRWEGIDKEIAPWSPDAQQKDIGFYTQLFGDLKNGLVTATVGLRLDIISAEVLSSKYFPNNISREEKFNVFSPSYGLIFSPIKHVTDDYSLTFYHNLGKGFIPQSAINIAGYSIGEPDNTGRVLVTHGNPDLEPERNITVDAGIKGGIKALGIDIGFGFYRTTVENFVQTTYENVPVGMTETYNGVVYPVASVMTYKNNDDMTTMAGLEWDLEWNILQMFDKQEQLILGSNGHAVLLSENVTNDDTSEVFNVRNPNFNISLTYDDTKRINARLQTRFSGKQKDTDWSALMYPYPDIICPPFLVTDFTLRVKVNENHAVGASVANITDENYYEKRGYNMPGRTFGLEYELSF